MKKVAVILSLVALVSCGGGDSTNSTVDSTVVDSVKVDSVNVDSTVSVDTSVVK